MTCIKCGHARTSHSKRKCEEYVNPQTGQECPCKVKYMDAGMFK